MKSLIAGVALCVVLVIGIRAAAVEPVVEELQSDVSATSTVRPEEELMTNEDCRQPKETGRCFALFYRYAYDVEKRECVEFIYGGCAGNSNNFETKEDCESKCMNKTPLVVDVTTVVMEEEVQLSDITSPTSTPTPDALTH